MLPDLITPFHAAPKPTPPRHPQLATHDGTTPYGSSNGASQSLDIHTVLHTRRHSPCTDLCSAEWGQSRNAHTPPYGFSRRIMKHIAHADRNQTLMLANSDGSPATPCIASMSSATERIRKGTSTPAATPAESTTATPHIRETPCSSPAPLKPPQPSVAAPSCWNSLRICR